MYGKGREASPENSGPLFVGDYVGCLRVFISSISIKMFLLTWKR